jgi:hypothetical protein
MERILSGSAQEAVSCYTERLPHVPINRHISIEMVRQHNSKFIHEFPFSESAVRFRLFNCTCYPFQKLASTVGASGHNQEPLDANQTGANIGASVEEVEMRLKALDQAELESLYILSKYEEYSGGVIKQVIVDTDVNRFCELKLIDRDICLRNL